MNCYLMKIKTNFGLLPETLRKGIFRKAKDKRESKQKSDWGSNGTRITRIRHGFLLFLFLFENTDKYGLSM